MSAIDPEWTLNWPTPNPSRKREGSETCQAAGLVSRSGVGNPVGTAFHP